MSEKPHTSKFSFRRLAQGKPMLFLLFWLILFTFVYFSAHLGRPILETLAAKDPDPARQIRLDALRTTRALLPAPKQGGALLWEARRSDGAAGVFLAGAVRAERQGQPAAAHLWLTLECLSRGDGTGANRLLQDAGTSLTLPAGGNPRDPATWEGTPLGQALRQNTQGN